MTTKTLLTSIQYARIPRFATVFCLCVTVLCSGCAPSVSRLEKKGDTEGLTAILASSTETLERRADAARSLGNVGSPLAVEALVRALQDFFELEAAYFQGAYQNSFLDVDRAVSATADALGQIGDPRAVDPLIAALEAINKEDPDTGLRRIRFGTDGRDAVARALGKLGDAKALMPLFRSAATGCGHAEDCASWAAIQALGAPTAAELLEVVAAGPSEDSFPYSFVLQILVDDQDPSVHADLVEALVEALPTLRSDSSSYSGHHWSALQILAEETDPRIRTVLEAEVRSPDPFARYEAAYALARFLRYDADELLPYLDSKQNMELFYPVLIQIGKPGTEPALIAALDKFGDEPIAVDYYESGNEELHMAGYWWLDKRNVEVWVLSGSCGDPCWAEGPDESIY